MNELEKLNISLPITNDFVKDIKLIINEARKQTYRSINTSMIQAYWLIGQRIIIQEQKGEKRAEYGSKLIENLSKELVGYWGNGMSVAQLWNCRLFYSTFPDTKILYTLCRELNWSKIRLIMRLNSEKERNFYINEAKNGNWSVRELERNIKTDMFHRMLNQQSINLSENKNTEIIKDPYILEFLGLQKEITENKLEKALCEHLEHFLLEMGRGFCFVERQMHIATETKDFYIDIVFYNYILKCFVLVDLKIDELSHSDIGQMDMYVRMFDKIKKCEDDNPTIGIIFCTDKDESIVRYSVLNESKQIFASRYKTVLPTEEELKEELEKNRHFLENKSN